MHLSPSNRQLWPVDIVLELPSAVRGMFNPISTVRISSHSIPIPSKFKRNVRHIQTFHANE